ncbi:transposase [Caldibacillus debilis]|uniref:transposase n=1 Tax=Caldibacillus debilis TaxID=301148 RepID=UPI003C6C0FEF
MPSRPLIIAGRFPYCRYVYCALDQVRGNEQQAVWSNHDRKQCKCIRRFFYKKEERNAKEQWYLNRYFWKSESLKNAYELKEAFCHWL